MLEENNLKKESVQDILIEGEGYSSECNEDINPGLILRDFLQKLCPIRSDAGLSFISQIDYSFKADGALSELVYKSTINYLVRRLINTAEYLRRKYESDDFPEGTFVQELRSYLKSETRFRDPDIEKIISIIQACLSVRNQRRKSRQAFVKHKKQIGGAYGLLCYICGKSLSSEEEIQVEHNWPKALGGSSKYFNLRLSCKSCNSEKGTYIDGSDFHYEHICLSTDETNDGFNHELKGLYRVALSAKSNYRCTLCEGDVESVGRLRFVRRNPNDSWHYLNIDAICEGCFESLSLSENGNG